MADEFDINVGLTRREALKRGAMLGGALVWAIPVVQTVGMTAAMAQTVSPELLFFDNFSGEGSANVLNYASFTNWNVTRASVDLLTNPAGYSIPLPGTIVDLDGTTNSGGRIETKTTFSLPTGTYRLSFDIAGNQRSSPADSVTVSLGAEFSETFIRNPSDPLVMIQRDITVGSDTTGKIVFDHAGGDNVGILLNSVKLERIA
jgi:hypothetical protein